MPISQIVTNSIANGAVGATQTAATNQFYNFKNRIINGNGVINQRNTSVSAQTISSSGYTVLPDRFFWYTSGPFDTFTYQPSTNAPAGFSNSIQINASSVSGLAGAILGQVIEGFNINDFNFGTANASAVTLSFWVNVSRTGSYGLFISNSSSNFSVGPSALYATTYSVTSANTWQRITVTVPGPTSGTWNITNGAGLNIAFTLVGTFTGTSTVNTWDYAPFPYDSIVGQTSLQSGDTFRVTGIQLEKGSTATSWDTRSYGTELALCQRYYQRSTGQVGVSDAYGGVGWSYIQCQNVNWIGGNLPFKVNMRAAPTFRNSGFAGTIGTVGRASTVTDATISLQCSAEGTCSQFASNVATGSESIMLRWDASSEL